MPDDLNTSTITNDEKKQKGDPPVIKGVQKGVQRLALWLEEDQNKKNQFTGVLDGDRVWGYLQTRKEGDKAGQKFIHLQAKIGKEYRTVAYGNPVNRRSDDKPVYYDEFVFHIDDQDIFGARLAKTASVQFQQEVGFNSPRLDRPAKVENDESTAPSP